MMDAVPYASAKIEKDQHCRDCGWPIVFLCVNGLMATTPPWAGNDWWLYCANPACQHHTGEGLWQSTPDWIQRT